LEDDRLGIRVRRTHEALYFIALHDAVRHELTCSTGYATRLRHQRQRSQRSTGKFINISFFRKRAELLETIKTYKPTDASVSRVRVLLVGPVGAGKSSFFNSINSVFRGHVTSQAIAGCSCTSLTTKV